MISFHRILLLTGSILICAGCATVPDRTEFISNETGEHPGAGLWAACLTFAARERDGTASAPYGANPSASDHLGSAVGNSIGDNIVFRRALSQCMKDNGFEK